MEQVVGQLSELDFLTKLQRILSEGVFVASYKYALLLSLAELSVENEPAFDGTLRIGLDDLAERFITLYWRQVAPFGRSVLSQNAGRQASIINKIALFKQSAPTLSIAKTHRDWHRLVRQVGRLLVQMPLWKLQLVGDKRVTFLYEERLIDNAIVLKPGVAACFRAQFVVVQALVQSGWLSFVQRLPANRPILGVITDLVDFLFGAERSGLRTIAKGLLELQKKKCFYCDRVIRSGGDVDHFIPWSRYPLDLGHNFVLAHAHCNQDKRDMLAATGHLQRWIERNGGAASTLRQIFDDARFPYDADASFSVAEWAYESAHKVSALVWVRFKGQISHLSDSWRDCFK